VQLSGDEDLALGDISGQVWYGMSDIVAGHGQDGELGDGALLLANGWHRWLQS